jgi:hypothetical protein
MIARLSADLARFARTRALCEIPHQQVFLVSWPYYKHSLTVLQRLIDSLKEGRIFESSARADGISLVMQVLACQISVDCLLVNRFQPKIKDLGDAMINPYDGVIVNSHDFFGLDEGSSGICLVSATSAQAPSSIRTWLA